MARKALIDKTTGLVVNIIEADNDWVPPDGFFTLTRVAAHIGDSWNGRTIVHPESIDGVEQLETPEQKASLEESWGRFRAAIMEKDTR